jgi:putative transposase
MTANAQKRPHRSISVKGYSPDQLGTYLVTTSTYQRECLFGKVEEGHMHYNRLGLIVRRTWLDLTRRYPHVILDAFCVMPNLFQGVIVLIDESNAPGLSEIVRTFKSISTRQINTFRDSPGISVWQRNYYKRAVSLQPELERIRESIERKPLSWRPDREDLLKNLTGEKH